MTSDPPARSLLRVGWRLFGYLRIAVCLLCLAPCPATAQITGGPPRIRNVYIPSDQLKVLFDDSSKGVLMPRDKILSLWREAHGGIPSETVVPAGSVLTQASYDARLGNDELRITGRLKVVKLSDGWEAVDLRLGGLAIESALLGDQPAQFGRRDDGTLFLLLQQAGRFELNLEMSAPLASKEGDLATTLQLPPIPASEILIPLDDGKQLRIGETMRTPEHSEHGGQTFRIAVDRTGLVPLLISDRSAGGNRAPLVFVRSRSVATIEPAGLRWRVALDLDVYARASDSFELRLPALVDIAEVEAPDLARWTIREQDGKEQDGPLQAGDESVVTLSFRKPFLGRRTVELLALAPVPMALEWNLPTLKVAQAAAHVGEVEVHASPSLRIEVGALASIRPERLSSPADDARRAPLAFAFWDEDFRLPLKAISRQGTLQASVATLVEADRTGVVLRSSVTVEPRHAPIFALRIQLPRDWDVTSVLAGDQNIEWESRRSVAGDHATGPPLQTVQVDLTHPLRPDQSLEIALAAEQHPSGWLEQDEGFNELPLPELRVFGADEVEGTLLIRTPPDIDLLVSDLSDDLQPVAADRSADASARQAGAALQYRYQDQARMSGRIQVRVKPAKVSARTLAFVRPDHAKLDVHYQLDLHVAQGTIRQIRFLLPPSVGNKVQVVPVGSAARIIEQQVLSSNGADDTGSEPHLWQIVLDRPVTGDLTLAVDFEQPFPSPMLNEGAAEAARGTAGAPVSIPVLTLQNVSRQSGIVALEAAGDQQLDYQAENLRELDPADVAAPKAYVPRQRIIAAYQYSRLPYRLTIATTRHISEAVLAAVCESAEITSVTGRHGRMRHQAQFLLRSLNLHHVPMTLPESAELWAVLLDGQPVEVRRQDGTYIVPLPPGRDDSVGELRDLTLLYETDCAPLAASGFYERLRPHTIRQTGPKIAMTTLGTTWYVHPADGTDLVSSGGEFEPVTRLTRPTLVSSLAQSIAFQSTHALPWKVAGLVAAALLVGFIALLSTGKGCATNFLQMLTVLVVLCVVIALLLPATQSAREAARRLQCTNNLKQIGIALHLYHDVHKQFPPAAIGPHNVPRERQFSWIVAILPYLEQQGLHSALRLDLPWDHPHNAGLLQMAPQCLLCPTDPAPSTTQEGFFRTSYVAVTGARFTDGPGSPHGVIGLDKGLAVRDIVDGTSNTIMVMEVTDGGPWFAGGASTARPIDDWLRNKAWSHHPYGANVVMADGAVQLIGTDTDPRTLRSLATAQGQEPIDDPDYSGGHGTPTPSKTQPAADSTQAPPRVEEAQASASHARTPDIQDPFSGQYPYEPSGGRARRSLRIALETGQDRAVPFRREGSPGELVLELQDRSFADTLRWLLVAAALLSAWVVRRAPASWRAAVVTVGLALPIGLAGLVPLAWTPLLDGLLLGALAAGLVWSLPTILAVLNGRIRQLATTVAVIGISVALTAGAGVAQEAADNAAPQPTDDSERRPDLTLFIPYDPDDGNPLENTQVFLPHEEFLRLWKQAHPDAPDPAGLDVRAMVSHAEYSGRLEHDVARFDGRLVVYHLDDGWTQVPLPLGDVALESVAINGQPAPLAGDPSAVFFDQSGLHVVDVRFSVPVSRLGATGRFTLPLRAVPSGRLLFQLPEGDLDVQVGGSSGGWCRHVAVPVREGDAPANGTDAARLGECVSIPLGAAADLSLRWQPRRVEARGSQLVSVDQSLLVEVRETGVHLHGDFQFRVQQGSLSGLLMDIPRGMAVRQVQGPDVADWSIETAPADNSTARQQRLVIRLKAELTAGTDLTVDCFRHARLGDIDIEALEPLGVARETGQIALAASSAFRVRVSRSDRLDQINHTGLELHRQPHDSGALFAAYRYNTRPWSLQLQVDRYRPRVEILGRTAVAVSARQATVRSSLTAAVTGSPVASLELLLPAALRVSQVRVPPGAEWFIGRTQAGQQLSVKLVEPVVGRLEVAVSGSLARDSGQAEFVVPGVTVQDVDVQRGQLAVYLDDDLEAVLVSDGGARSIDPAVLDSSVRADVAGPARYAFHYDTPPHDLRLRLNPAPSRLNADVTSVVSVREGAVAYVSQVAFEIRQAGRSQLRFVTPQWLGDDLELQGDAIRQIRSQLSDAGQTWEIELQQPVRGTYRLRLVQTLPLSDDGTVSAAIIRPLDAERSRSHVVLENLTADEIAATRLSGATAIAIAEVPGDLTDPMRRQAVAAYRINDDGVLVWQRRVREQETGLAATISLADLTTVIHADGRYRARAAYNIRNFRLQFLELELPPDSEVWSVHVSGQPVRPAKLLREGRTITLLPLQKTSAGDFSSKVDLIYSGHLGEPLNRWTRIHPPAPRILSDAPVSRTLWTVLLPREYRVGLAAGQSNLERVGAAFQQEERKLSFLDELKQMVQVASVRDKSSAGIKARYNLKQIGSALSGYAQQSGPADTKNALEVQEQVQQIEAEIKRLDETKADARDGDGDTDFYFGMPPAQPGPDEAGIRVDARPETLAESVTVDGRTAAEEKEAELRDQPDSEMEQQRGRLREQAAAQLERLQTMEQERRISSKDAEPELSADLPRVTDSTATRLDQHMPQPGPVEPSTGRDLSGTGYLSLDLDLAPVGVAYHFRKLHGEPRLVLHARHEDLVRRLTAVLWAGFCLVLAAAVARGLWQPNSASLAHRRWPWLAIIAGVAWSFLLPAGVLGLALIVVASFMLIRRIRG